MNLVIFCILVSGRLIHLLFDVDLVEMGQQTMSTYIASQISPKIQFRLLPVPRVLDFCGGMLLMFRVQQRESSGRSPFHANMVAALQSQPRRVREGPKLLHWLA